MTMLADILGAAGAFVVIYVVLAAAVTVGRRRLMVTRCPATRDVVMLEVERAHALRRALTGAPRLRVEGCTLWPARSGCDHACLRDGRAPSRSSTPR